MIRQLAFALLLLTFHSSQAKEASHSSVATTIATEVVIFESKNSISQQILLQAAVMEKTLQSWDGFLNRELIDLGDGKWIDIVHCSDMASAQEKAMHSEIFLTFFSLIKEENMQMFHGDQKLMQLQKGSLLGHIQ